MEYRIEIEAHATQNMVHTFIWGVMSEKELNRISAETVRAMRKNNITKVILDIREAELNDSFLQSHPVVLILAALGIRNGDYVAVIYFHNKEQHEYARNAVLNRGIMNLGYYRNLKEGIGWLTGKE